MNVEEVKKAVEAVRPHLQMDGGDVEFVDFDEQEGVVQVRLMGHCVGCAASMMTLKHGIESRLRASVPEVKTVEAI